MAQLVDTVESCRAAVAQLFQDGEVAIDVEGVDLSRVGEVCLIQMCGSSSPTVYLFDIYVMGQEAFEAGGLKALLESEDVTKLFYDVRGDNDALYHLHSVDVRAAYDIQVLWHFRFHHPHDVYLQGLKKVFRLFQDQSKTWTTAEMSAMERAKERGARMFAPEQGGSYEVWKQRPLDPEILEYAVMDVKFLLAMRRFWSLPGAEASTALEESVRTVSSARLRDFVALPEAAAIDHSNKKFLDFQIPDGFNDTGDIIQRVHVPSDKRGLVVGRKGATIQGIQSSSGARVSLQGALVLVFGQPTQVREAVRQVNAIVV